MSTATAKLDPIVFAPNLRADDVHANYWMRQATLRLRREIAWIWHERGFGGQAMSGMLPPAVDKASACLDLTRYWPEKQQFFADDVAAGYLSGKLQTARPATQLARRGSFGWLLRELDLDDVSAFTLGLCLAASFDASMGPVIGACLNDSLRIYPNLMLIQRLWDEPERVLELADPMHAVFRFGLLQHSTATRRVHAETLWEQALAVPPMVARALTSGYPVVPGGVAMLDYKQAEKSGMHEDGTGLEKSAELIAYRLKSEQAESLRVVPLLGNKHSSFDRLAFDISRITQRSVWAFSGDPALLESDDYLKMLFTLCWLQDKDLLLHHLSDTSDKLRWLNERLPLQSIPLTLFIAITDRAQIKHIDSGLLLPVIRIPELTYEDRFAEWKKAFAGEEAYYDPILSEIARRFRYEKRTIRQLAAEIKAQPGKADENDFIAACRAELFFDIGELAACVEPRFIDERLILPRKQGIQFEEQLAAMRSLTKVHYNWGTARAWNEGGITVLFAGPPGTGKTMAAEIMAQQLKLPMYRIDLSQVVNKYIGETEKNLKRIFDAAEISDMVLFFDEADSLFGKRTEVSDSRDRYANLEVSYLLERMERFKGLAILATNRKRDLDEAFLRRIRYIIDFPVPEEMQRAEIWKQVIPRAVAADSSIDMPFLARQFPLSGGHIRSIVFNACLQSANASGSRKELHMKDIMIAVKREYDKMNRSLSLDQLGKYAHHIEALD